MRILDRYFQLWTGLLLGLMTVSFFLFKGALLTPLLLIYAALNLLRYRREMSAVLHRVTLAQKAAAVSAVLIVIAISTWLIQSGGRVLQAQGATSLPVYAWIALVLAGAVVLLRWAVIRLGFTSQDEKGQS